MKAFLISLIVVSVVSITSFAGSLVPSVGLNAGWVFPISNLSDTLNGSYQIGIFVRANSIIIPYTDLVLDVGYTSLPGKSSSDVSMLFIPISLSGEFAPLPDFGILPYLKLGGGIVLENYKNGSSNTTNTDPFFLVGLGGRQKISDKITLKIEGTYNYIYQKYISGSAYDGTYINICAGILYQF